MISSPTQARGLAKTGAQQARAIAQRGEEAERSQRRGDGEDRAMWCMLGRDGPSSTSIQIDMRIGPGQRGDGEHPLPQGSAPHPPPPAPTRRATRPERRAAIPRQERNAPPAQGRAKPGRRLGGERKARNAKCDQRRIRGRAEQCHRKHMLAPQALAQHECVLRPDRQDQTGPDAGSP